jgi:hypothetical protein
MLSPGVLPRGTCVDLVHYIHSLQHAAEHCIAMLGFGGIQAVVVANVEKELGLRSMRVRGACHRDRSTNVEQSRGFELQKRGSAQAFLIVFSPDTCLDYVFGYYAVKYQTVEEASVHMRQEVANCPRRAFLVEFNDNSPEIRLEHDDRERLCLDRRSKVQGDTYS